MANYRPLLLAAVCLPLGALVWFDNRDALSSMWAPPPGKPSTSGAKAQISPAGTPKPDATKAEGNPSAEQTPPSEVSLLTGNPLASYPKESLENWVQKPLFAPSRQRPPPAESKKVGQVQKPPPEYRLVGVLLNPNRTVALLQSADGGANFHVEVGDLLKGWFVASVERDAVTLKRDDETPQVIRFKNDCANAKGMPCP